MGSNLDPLNLRKVPLKNFILAYLKIRPCRIAGKKVYSLFLFLSQVIGVQKCYLLRNFEKMRFSPFSIAYYFLIDFSKSLQLAFPYSQQSLLNTLRNMELSTYVRIDSQTFTKFRLCSQNPTKNQKKIPNSLREKD